MPLDARAVENSSIEDLLVRRKGMVRELRSRADARELRVAVLGGTTTNEIVDLLEVHLLANGFQVLFYQSEYGRYYEDAVHDPQALIDFKPHIAFVHTSFINIRTFPPLQSTEAEFQAHVEAELNRFRQVWASLQRNLSCEIIQNNFEPHPYSGLGNLDAVSTGGRSRFLSQLNLAFAQEAAANPKLILQDIHGISSQLGLANWFDWDRWFSYKILVTPEASLAIARSLNAIIKAIYGKSRKVLVLDLDNTLWGGVIGDDGLDKIQIGRETPVAEAHTAFQEYCLALRNRGVLLAVCSKNEEDIAKQGFAHPDSVLKLEHFSAFKANWQPKHENLIAIAKELNLGIESFVFVDDNPAERAIVEAQLEGIAVPNVGNEVSAFAAIIDSGRYFETVAFSAEDLERATLYADNSRRTDFETKFADYGEYLDSLDMSAEIDEFKPVYMERIAQLTNKTNQFNLTTRRYTLAEMESIASSEQYITLYGKLRDRFGDNGLISVVVGRRETNALHIDLWLMSCRVLKRDMEFAMLDVLVDRAVSNGLERLVGHYLPTKKNAMVAAHYANLGFLLLGSDEGGGSIWELSIAGYRRRNHHIKIISGT
jgi:FkbH-like protein